MKRLIIITILFIITACTWIAFLSSAHAQLASASNSTAAAQTGSFPALTASKPVTNVTEPTQPQLSLRYVEFRDTMFFAGEPITMRVGPIRSNETGVYTATAVITPQIGDVESSYDGIASYSRDSNWFTFNFVLGETGNYTITIWQGGVKQLTREISVCNTTSTNPSTVPANPDTAVEAARTAAQSAGAAQSQSGSSGVPSQPLGIGVKPGDWAVYQKRFHQEQTDNRSVNTTRNYLYIIELRVISVNGTQLTYTQTDRLENGSVRLRATYTVDPTKPIYPMYNESGILENELNTMLAPSGLSVGDHLPQVIWLPSRVGDFVPYEWSQWVNSTTVEGDPLNPMTINHVEWSRDIHYVRDSYVTDFHEDSQLSFDQVTGLMLHAVIREELSSHSNSGQVGGLNYIYDYRLIDSSAIPHNYAIAGLTVATFMVAVLFVLLPYRRH